jgi:membrane associated rhomboid family serine protease
MFIAIPVGMNYRTERLPLVTLSLIGLNTLVWLVTLIFHFTTDGASDDWITQHLWLIPAKSFLWMYLTSMFVHAGIFHLLGNMIFLFLFGACVEDLIGRLRFAIFYLVSGLVAELVYIAMSPGHFTSPVPMGGASGAISGCMGMYLLLRAEADIEFKYFIWMFFVYVRAGEFEIPAWMAISFWFLKDLLWAILGLVYQNKGGGTAFGAHVGGLLGGLALIYFFKLAEQRRNKSEGKTDLIFDPTPALLSVAAAKKAAEISTSEPATIFLHDGNQQTGPFTLSQVQAMLQDGTVRREAAYWSEGMSDWESVADLAGQPLA